MRGKEGGTGEDGENKVKADGENRVRDDIGKRMKEDGEKIEGE